MNRIVLLALLLCALPASGYAERARTPADATVYIRVSVNVRAEVSDGTSAGRRVEAELYRGSGSGFVISPLGHVITNRHVVSPEFQRFVFEQWGVKAKGTLSVGSIAVCVPRESAAWADLVARSGPDESKCLDASLLAEDAELDLAVLSLSAPNLPYLAMGDSDAVTVGQAQQALGFPLGARLEIGKEVGPDVVPSLTQMPGAVSAIRMGCGAGPRRGPCATAADRDSARRFFQVSNNLNPGNSGGPVVDARGFAIGVVQSRLTGSAAAPVEGIGFAIPINVVKDFLEGTGLDSVLPVPRLRPGALHELEAKRLRLQMPEVLADVAATANRVETEPSPAAPVLRIDRVLSPWTTQRLEDELLGTATFERGSWSTREGRTAGNVLGRLRLGRATGELDGGGDGWLVYGIADLGAEKLVARYSGPAEHLAFNEKVLTDSLASLDGQRFPVPDVASVDRLAWTSGTDAQGQPAVPVPVGWFSTVEAPLACARLPRAQTAGTVSIGDDYSVTLRAAVWTDGNLTPDAAAASCSATRGSQPEASYSMPFDWLGVRYVADGVFVRTGPARLIRLEVQAPEARAAFAQALLAGWVRRARPAAR